MSGAGIPRAVLLVGGTSDIGLAIARRLIAEGARDVVLAARGDLSGAVAELEVMGATVTPLPLDLDDEAACRELLDSAVETLGDIDVVIDAVGLLGAGADPGSARAVADSVFGAHITLTLLLAERLRAQGHGVLVVLSSFAAVRPRPSLLVYGAAKAGLDAFARGLDAHLVGSGARVMLVRPGFVHTSMTEGLPKAPFAVGPDEVAEAVVRGLRRRSNLVWVPGVLRAVAAASRMMPRQIWLKLDR